MMSIRSFLFFLFYLLFSFSVYADDFSDAQKLFLAKQYTQSIPSFIRAANAENSKAQALLSYLFENGLVRPIDTKQALTWHLKASKNQYDNAQAHLAYLCYTGQLVPQSYEKATIG